MSESAAAVAQDPAAPAAERFDAQADLSKSVLRDLVPAPEVQAVIDRIQEHYADQDMMKARGGGNVVVGPWAPQGSNKRGGRGPESVILDEFQIVAQGNYWDRPGILGFDSMRGMVKQTPVLSAIIGTRIRQVQRFCRPQANKSEAGFLIQHVDPTVELDDQQQQSVKLLQSFMVNGGWEQDPRKRKRLKRDTFSQFMAKSVRDALTMDAAPIETEFKRDKTLGLDGFYAVDGATIRLCTEEGYDGDDEIFALQVIQGNIRTAYTYDQLIYEVRNPQTDVISCGYGLSETEQLIRIVTYLLNTLTYNGSFFDKNAIPRGILHLSGNYDQGDLAAFKRYWNSMVRGIANAHNLPFLVSKDQESKADFTEIGGQLDEMAFSRWLVFLTSIACAVYNIAPEEISMESFAASKSSLSGDDTEEKLVMSNDKGLRPLLNYYENVFSDFVIQTYSNEYCFRFAGLDADDATKRFEMRKLVCTVNEARGQEGYDPIEGKLGDAPLNAGLLGVWQQIEGIGQQQGDFGNPDEGGPLPGADQPPQAGGPDDGTQDAEGAGDQPDFGSDGEEGGHSGGNGGPPQDEDMGKAFGMPVFKIEG